ncbi:MAG: Protein-export membrane protein SecG [Candidatus Anoxychlamydiales bacterium]|nr:Protein-export membrane protein SecG [Candidatus Anoxychlamydiales bacterium]NGX35298.1 Protein-export membrane protein SecG [Candidatus Anoxychlamydiales bacterium]
MTFLYYLFLFLFMFLCVLTITVILSQESKSMGLGSAFGGDASSSLFGTSTADVLKKFTTYLITIFMISCVVLSLWSSGLGRAKEKAIPTVIEEVQK